MSVVIFTLIASLAVILAVVLLAFFDVAFGRGGRLARPCYSMIAVTPPEAFELADYLRTHKPSGMVSNIRDRAAANAQRSQELDHNDFHDAQLCCPLLGDDGVCIVGAVRPVHCWGRCALSGGEGRCGEGFGRRRIDSVEAGLCRGLRDAGLDGNLYELNSALVTALETPDAAAKWRAGDDVFSRCKRYR